MTTMPETDGDDNAQPVQFNLIAQYVRDFSFENPGAPATLAASQPPEIEIAVDLAAQRHTEDRFEVDLKIHANAKTAGDGKPVFVVELVYAGLFLIQNVPEEALQPFCLIECPRLMFPFARRIIADATRDGGFPPLLLDPIDFVALFRQRVSEEQVGQA